MLIISQNQMRIVEMTGVVLDAVESDNGYKIVARTATDIVMLGKYPGERRAKEVLLDIAGKYNEYHQVNNSVSGVQGIFVVPKVYEMPIK